MDCFDFFRYCGKFGITETYLRVLVDKLCTSRMVKYFGSFQQLGVVILQTKYVVRKINCWMMFGLCLHWFTESVLGLQVAMEVWVFYRVPENYRCLVMWQPLNQEGLPGSWAGEEWTCNAGDPGSIPGLGRSAGEGIGYPLQILGLPLWLNQ